MDITEKRRNTKLKRVRRVRLADSCDFEEKCDDDGAIPVTVKIMVERRLTDSSEVNIPTPPPGMCLDLDAMEDDESGEDAPVLFTRQDDDDDACDTAGDGRVELVTEAELRVGDVTELTWHEPGTSGEVVESVSFDTSAPDVVTYRRINRNMASVLLAAITNRNEPQTVLVLERGRRHVSLCREVMGSTELTVRTFRLENSLLRRGTMLLDYSVEIHGVRVEKTRMVIKMHRSDVEKLSALSHRDTIFK